MERAKSPDWAAAENAHRIAKRTSQATDRRMEAS
jgi:hypothetical protein